MIAIDTILSLRDSEPTPLLDIDQAECDRSQMLIPYYTQIRDFFQACIDQNLILNACIGDVNVSNARYDKCRFYATTPEKAQEFADKLFDMTADFSMKKMWDEFGFDSMIEQHEIDFDSEPMPYQIIPDDGDLFQYRDQIGVPLLPDVN